jgi:hypothetical protein
VSAGKCSRVKKVPVAGLYCAQIQVRGVWRRAEKGQDDSIKMARSLDFLRRKVTGGTEMKRMQMNRPQSERSERSFDPLTSC